jgi:succinate dehydrogenase/fumarate reductase cytochrome b subunit
MKTLLFVTFVATAILASSALCFVSFALYTETLDFMQWEQTIQRLCVYSIFTIMITHAFVAIKKAFKI